MATWRILAIGLSLLVSGGNAFAQPETLYLSVRSSRKANPPGGDPRIGLFISRDAGKTWQHRGWREQIKVFHTEAGPDGALWSACGNGVLRSTDSGATWKVTTGWEVTEALKVRVDPANPRVIYAATALGIFKTSDRGETWIERNRGLGSTFVSDILVDAADPMRFLAATEEGVYASADGGEGWSLAGLEGKGIRTLARDPGPAGRIWAGTEDDGVFRSRDGGKTWRPCNHGAPLVTVYAIAVHPRSADTVYLGTHEGGVYRSVDGGGSWRRSSSGLEAPMVHALAILPSNPRIIFAGTINGGLYRSGDGGDTWEFQGQEEGQVWGLSIR